MLAEPKRAKGEESYGRNGVTDMGGFLSRLLHKNKKKDGGHMIWMTTNDLLT